MTTRPNDALNQWIRQKARGETPAPPPEPEPVRYAAGSADGGKGGRPLPPSPEALNQQFNDLLRQEADRVKGRW